MNQLVLLLVELAARFIVACAEPLQASYCLKVTVLESQNSVRHRGDDCAINDCETAVLVAHHEEALVFCCLNACHRGSNPEQSLFCFVQRTFETQLLCGSQGISVEAVVGQQSNLIRDFANELETCNVVSVHSALLGSQQKTVIAGAYLREEGSLLAHSAHELSLTVKDENFAIGAENEHETS